MRYPEAMRFGLLTTGIIFIMSQTVQSQILVHGHRGARALRPENTLPAFEYAIQAGADVLELDLAVTRDNILVASHDPVLNEKICRGPSGTAVIREMTLDQLRRWDCGSLRNPDYQLQQIVPGTRVPTLDEVFALAGRGHFEFNVETKIFGDRPEYTPEPAEFAQLLVSAIRKHRLESRCIIQSFDFRTLTAAARLAPEIRRAALYMGPPRDLVAMTQQALATILSPHYSLVKPEIVSAAHRAGLQVIPWTPNKPADWDRMIDAQADAIITDDPAGLISHLRRRGLRR
jgi:glycerophosphoryl diester phosphodiesterase